MRTGSKKARPPGLARANVPGDGDTKGGRRLRVTQRHRHELRGVANLHPHQDVVLALRLRFLQRLDHVIAIGDRLAADVEDDVAGLEIPPRPRVRWDQRR